MFAAVIFDMDGVIVDSEPLHIKAERITLAPYGLDIPDAEFHAYMGQTPKMLIADMIRKYRLPVSLEALYGVHRKNLLQLYRNEVQPVPGALELIGVLHADKIPLGLASSSDIDLIDTVLARFRLNHILTVTSSGQEVSRPKPAPDIFILEAERLGVKPSQCVVIEDSTNGIRAAKSAGMTCIGFDSPNSHNQQYDEADMVVDDLRQLDPAGLRVLQEAVIHTEVQRGE